MNVIYGLIYVVICVIIFMIMFMSNEIFNLLFETKYNNILDFNDPNYTGGIDYIFNPFRHFSCQTV